MVGQESEQASDLLVDDFVTIQAALSSPELKTLQASILAGTATDAGIEAHYRAYDAIDSPTSFKNEKAAYLHAKKMGRVALADFIGGTQIITSTLMGGALKTNGGYDGVLSTTLNGNNVPVVERQLELGNIGADDVEDWNGILDILDHSKKTANQPLKNLAERVGLLHAARLLGLLEGDVYVATTPAIKALSLGRTIMTEGTRSIRLSGDVHKSELLRSETDKNAANRLVKIAENPLMLLGLSELMLRSANSLDSLEAKDIFLNELKNVAGATLGWPTAEPEAVRVRNMGQYEDVDAVIQRKMQQVMFTEVLGNMKLLTNFARNNNPNMFQKGRVKGSLHEVLWMLDAYAIRQGMPSRYGSYVVNTATEAEDMPFIGKPSMKRGYDFVILPRLDSMDRRLVQVGAGSQKRVNILQRPYHPDVETYCEEPFNEVNLTTLEKKLDAYAKWAEGGFTEKDYARLKIHDLLLGTVKDCFKA